MRGIVRHSPLAILFFETENDYKRANEFLNPMPPLSAS
jgi:hypothetical protein